MVVNEIKNYKKQYSITNILVGIVLKIPFSCMSVYMFICIFSKKIRQLEFKVCLKPVERPGSRITPFVYNMFTNTRLFFSHFKTEQLQYYLQFPQNHEISQRIFKYTNIFLNKYYGHCIFSNYLFCTYERLPG